MPRPLIPNRPNVVLDAARELILRQGYDNTTMAQIARHAGIGKGAIYREFAGKEALLEALLLRSGHRLVAGVRRRIGAANGAVGLGEAYRFGLLALLDDDLMLAFYLGNPAVLGAYVHDVADGRYQARMRWLTDYLADLQLAGAVDGEVEPETVAFLLGSITLGLATASSVLGPVSPARFEAAVDLLIGMVESRLESGRDPDRQLAKSAQESLLTNLDTQLEELRRKEEIG